MANRIMDESEEKPTPIQLMSVAEMGGCPEVDLHGKDVIDAETTVEGFLSRAYRDGDLVVKIVHGKGTGKLQDAIRKLLRDHPLVVASGASGRMDEMGAVMYAVMRLPV